MDNLNEIIYIGQLDRRIVIQSATESEAPNGEILNTWKTHATVWANYEPLGSSEVEQDGRIQIISTAKFTVRYNSTLNEKHRVSYKSKIYNIDGIIEVGRERFQILECESTSITSN